MAEHNKVLDAFEADLSSAFGITAERIEPTPEGDYPYECGPVQDAYVLWSMAYQRFVTDGWRM